MPGRQLDLFSAGGVAPEPNPQPTPAPCREAPADLDDDALLAAIPEAGLADGPALAMEAGRRRLGAAVTVLEQLCRRFAGFGVDHLVPEQAAAMEALAMIGSREAARTVARVVAKGVVQGPNLKAAVAAAARLEADLPAQSVIALLRHADPVVRADACRCARAWPEAIPILVDLLDDLQGDVSTAAACALGRSGRPEARPALIQRLRETPSPEVIDAAVPIADEECVVLLARIVRTAPGLSVAALEALDAVDHPRAAPVLAALMKQKHTLAADVPGL
ncbi:MAG: HEAT repeat domain-containing protein [Rhodospirillales bacterium]|nr:HEAT repeat domain-containing protein [Rhodospirillales bacterium]